MPCRRALPPRITLHTSVATYEDSLRPKAERLLAALSTSGTTHWVWQIIANLPMSMSTAPTSVACRQRPLPCLRRMPKQRRFLKSTPRLRYLLCQHAGHSRDWCLPPRDWCLTPPLLWYWSCCGTPQQEFTISCCGVDPACQRQVCLPAPLEFCFIVRALHVSQLETKLHADIPRRS